MGTSLPGSILTLLLVTSSALTSSGCPKCCVLLTQDKEGTWVWPCLPGKCGKEPGKCPFASISPVLVPLGGTRWGKAGNAQTLPPYRLCHSQGSLH